MIRLVAAALLFVSPALALAGCDKPPLDKPSQVAVSAEPSVGPTPVADGQANVAPADKAVAEPPPVAELEPEPPDGPETTSPAPTSQPTGSTSRVQKPPPQPAEIPFTVRLEEQHRLKGLGPHLPTLRYSDDGETLLGSDGRKIVAWETERYKKRRSVKVRHSGWSARDGLDALACGHKEYASLRTPGGKKELRRFEGHWDWVEGVVVDPDSEWIATLDDSPAIRVFELSTGELRAHRPGERLIQDLAGTRDGAMLAWVDQGGQLELFDPDTSQRLAHETLGARADRLAFSQDARFLALAINGTPRASQRTVPAPTRDFRPAISGPTVMVLELDGAQIVAERVMSGHSNFINALAIAPDGRVVATGGQDHTVLLWDVGQQRESARLEAGGWVYDLAFHPSGEYLAVGVGHVGLKDRRSAEIIVYRVWVDG